MDDLTPGRADADGPRYRVSGGIRFRRQTGGEAMLLVPDGIVALDEATAAVLERADGETGLMTIVSALAPRLDVSEETFAASVRERLELLVKQGFIIRTDRAPSAQGPDGAAPHPAA